MRTTVVMALGAAAPALAVAFTIPTSVTADFPALTERRRNTPVSKLPVIKVIVTRGRNLHDMQRIQSGTPQRYAARLIN